MSATKILWGQIAVVFAIVLITMWAATQWTAWQLGYQPQLGRPWFELDRGFPSIFHRPSSGGGTVYDAYAPAVFVEGACIAASGGIISIVVAFAMSVWRAREARRRRPTVRRVGRQLEVRAAGLAARRRRARQFRAPLPTP